MHSKYLFKYLPTRSSFSVSLLFALLMLLLYNFCAKYFTPHNFLEIYIFAHYFFFAFRKGAVLEHIYSWNRLSTETDTHLWEWLLAWSHGPKPSDAVGSFCAFPSRYFQLLFRFPGTSGPISITETLYVPYRDIKMLSIGGHINFPVEGLAPPLGRC